MIDIKQKKIAVINDLAGFGKCALSVSMPVISAMNIQCCPLPTAILSTNTAFPDYYMKDFTMEMDSYIDHWRRLGLTFDGICTGFFASAEQIDLTGSFIKDFKKEDTVVIIDPIMGDNGHLYSSYNDKLCKKMQSLLPMADILLPNLTEACYLLDTPYSDELASDHSLREIAWGLQQAGAKNIVITGIPRDHQLLNYILYEDGRSESVLVNKIGENRCGTGDVFSSVLVGAVVQGMDILQAVEKAASFLCRCLEYTNALQLAPNHGLAFEKYLKEL